MLARLAAVCAVAAIAAAVPVLAQQAPPGEPAPNATGPDAGAPPRPPATEVPPPPEGPPPAGRPQLDIPGGAALSRPPVDERGPPSSGGRWGAVAYTADGAFGGAYGMDSEIEAERLAVAECMKQSTDKADCSRGVLKGRDNWFHIQFCRRDRDWSTHVTMRPTLSEVNRAAAEFAARSRYGANACRLVPNGLFHSGGMHTRM